ncbi:MAG: proprotein convertase P-domain-containing protein, partial [Fuerstiella sp.]
FDTDGDRTTFSSDETDQIYEIWRRIAEDFAPFEINVTTIDSRRYDDGEGIIIAIGGDGSWQAAPAPTTSTGYSEFETFISGGGDNIAVVNAEAIGSIHELSFEASAIISNALGIVRSNSVSTNTPAASPVSVSAIGGLFEDELLDVFLPEIGGSAFQDPIAIILDPSRNNIPLRGDDHGQGQIAAIYYVIAARDDVQSGRIEKISDVDEFRFETKGGTGTIQVSGIDLTADPNAPAGVLNPGANLAPELRLLDANTGIEIQPATPDDDPSPLKVSKTYILLPTITYLIQVSPNLNILNRGNIGEYEVTLVDIDPKGVVISFPGDPAFPENDQTFLDAGLVERPAGQSLASDLFVTLVSTDPGEVTVTPTVTIPAGQLSATFDIFTHDDNLLDGEQSVDIIAFLNGELNDQKPIRIADYETLTVDASSASVLENAVQMEVTVRRSNVGDPAREDYWVSFNNAIHRYSPAGVLLTSVPVPWSAVNRPSEETVHDIHVMDDGRVVVYNGSGSQNSPVLSVYDGSTWSDPIVIDGLTAGRFVLDVSNSLNDSDPGAGGITSVGDFVFLTDTRTGNSPGGLVRVNVRNQALDHFAADSLGSRMFVNRSALDGRVDEIDPVTGNILNTIDLANYLVDAGSKADAITFDGKFLWVLRNSAGLGDILKIDPDTEVHLETHIVPRIRGTQGGLAYLNGKLYIMDIGRVGAGGIILDPSNAGYRIYNPTTRVLDGRIFSVQGFNPSNPIGTLVSSIAAIPEADRLVFYGVEVLAPGIPGGFGFPSIPPVLGAATIYEVGPNSGIVLNDYALEDLNSLSGRATFVAGTGIGTISDVNIGGSFLDELLYINDGMGMIGVFDRTGTQVDVNLVTSAKDRVANDNGYNAIGDIAGADIIGQQKTLSFRDVTIGLDGRLYGLVESGTEVEIYNPNTLSRVDGVVLVDAGGISVTVRAISVDENGLIYGGSETGELLVFDNQGNQIQQLSTGLGVISDIETNFSHEVIIADEAGRVQVGTRTAITDQTQFTDLANLGDVAFVSFNKHPSRPTGVLYVSLQSSDVTELNIPDSVIPVIFPEGLNEVQVTIDVVDDNEFDGPQLVTLNGISNHYVSIDTVVTVEDFETVGVLIGTFLTDQDGNFILDAAGRKQFVEVPSFNETDGPVIANAVKVFRTDTDGPFNVPDVSLGQVTDPTEILDNDVILSEPIVIEKQVSRITDVNVTLSLEHSWVPDLDVFLRSPSGTRVELFTDLSSNESSITALTLDDESASRVIDANAPFTGHFIPERPLSTFDGEDPSGAWILEITDDNPTDNGVLLKWSLEISTMGISQTRLTLQSSDTDEATVPTSPIVIPAGRSEIFVDLTIVNDQIVEPLVADNVTISLAQLLDPALDAAFFKGSDDVLIVDINTLSVTLDKTEVSEGDGSQAAWGTITRIQTTNDLVISLTSDDPTGRLNVPTSVTIPDGQNSVSFDIGVINDLMFNENAPAVAFNTTATNYLSAISPAITIIDLAPRLSLSTLRTTISEDEGTITIVLARLDVGDLSVPQLVSLVSNDESSVTVPATFLIPAGAVSTTFTATIIDDNLLEIPAPGTEGTSVTITAADTNTANRTVNSSTLELVVKDAEFLSITVPSGSERILENAGVGAAVGTVSVSTAGHTSPIIVNLTSSDLSEASVPQQILIPVGETSATFSIDAINDSFIDRDQAVAITATSANYRQGVLDITVADHEPPILTGPGFETGDPTPALTWSPVDGATRYDLWLNDV